VFIGLILVTDVRRYSVAKLFVGRVESMTRKVEKFLGPIITERLENDAKYGPNWEGRPVSLRTFELE
jgi:hypothetical protein